MSHTAAGLARRVHVLRSLERPLDAPLLCRILVVAAAVPALTRLPLPRVAALITPRRRPPHQHAPERLDRIASYVPLAQELANPFVRTGCLTLGVTRYYFLRRAGLEVSLCFGVGAVGQQRTGHCWLELGGQPFLETLEPSSFTETYRIPPQ